MKKVKRNDSSINQTENRLLKAFYCAIFIRIFL